MLLAWIALLVLSCGLYGVGVAVVGLVFNVPISMPFVALVEVYGVSGSGNTSRCMLNMLLMLLVLFIEGIPVDVRSGLVT